MSVRELLGLPMKDLPGGGGPSGEERRGKMGRRGRKEGEGGKGRERGRGRIRI